MDDDLAPGWDLNAPPLFMCSVCDKPVDPQAPGVWRRQEVWAQATAAGKLTTSARRPGYPKAYAHPLCFDLAERGMADQGTLL